MRCQEAQILLSTRRDLNLSQRAELDAHLCSCRVCAVARREEDRVSHLLATLPDLSLTPPPRVAAAIAARTARRTATVRLGRGIALASSLGAVALFAALLLNIAAGGRLGWLLFGAPPEADTAAVPTPAALAPNDDTLYLIHRPNDQAASLIAWKPYNDETIAQVPLGSPPVFILRDASDSLGRQIEVQLPPRDMALAPNGDSLYVIEYTRAGAELVAYDLPTCAERWRVSLLGYEPYIVSDGGGNLSVSPDGARVFVRGIRPGGLRVGEPPELEVSVYGAGLGRLLVPGTVMPTQSQVLALNQHEILAFDPRGGLARVVLGRAWPWAFMEQSIAAGILLPDWRTVRAVTVDTKVVDLALVGPELRVASEVDLIPRGGFFFDYAAFAPDGQTLVVGQAVSNPQVGSVKSEVRIYRAGPWREVGRYTLDRELNGLAVSADGARIYLMAGPEGVQRWIGGPGRRPTPTPGPLPTRGPVPEEALVTLDAATGRELRVQKLDRAIVGMLAGR